MIYRSFSNSVVHQRTCSTAVHHDAWWYYCPVCGSWYHLPPGGNEKFVIKVNGIKKRLRFKWRDWERDDRDGRRTETRRDGDWCSGCHSPRRAEPAVWYMKCWWRCHTRRVSAVQVWLTFIVTADVGVGGSWPGVWTQSLLINIVRTNISICEAARKRTESKTKTRSLTRRGSSGAR